MRVFLTLLALALSTPAASAEITTLLSSASGDPFVTTPYEVRFVDGHLVFSQNASEFPAPHDEFDRNRYWTLDVDTLELTPIGLEPLYPGVNSGRLVVPPLVDGRYTAYVANEGNAVDATVPTAHEGDLVFFADLETDTHTAISKLPDDTYPASPDRDQRFLLRGIAISPDARYVVYWSNVGALSPDADPDPAVWNLFAYDRTADQTLLVTDTGFTGAQAVRPSWFLADGRLVAHLPMDTGHRVQPIVFDTIGAPGEPLFDGFDDGAVIEYLSDDGKYAYVGEQDGIAAVTGVRWRVDLVTDERVALCEENSGTCIATANASSDGRYLAYHETGSTGRLTDLESEQTIDTGLRFMSVAPDGGSVFGYLGGEYAERELLLARVYPEVTAVASTETVDDEVIDVLTYDVEVTNASAQAVAIEIFMTLAREAGEFVMESSFTADETDFDCDYQNHAKHCGLFALGSGETWTGRIRLEDRAPGNYRLTVDVDSLNHFHEDPAAAKTDGAAAIEAPPPPPPPAPTPTPESGGGGHTGAWFVSFLLAGAFARNRRGRKMVGDTGIEPVTPAV